MVCPGKWKHEVKACGPIPGGSIFSHTHVGTLWGWAWCVGRGEHASLKRGFADMELVQHGNGLGFPWLNISMRFLRLGLLRRFCLTVQDHIMVHVQRINGSLLAKRKAQTGVRWQTMSGAFCNWQSLFQISLLIAFSKPRHRALFFSAVNVVRPVRYGMVPGPRGEKAPPPPAQGSRHLNARAWLIWWTPSSRPGICSVGGSATANGSVWFLRVLLLGGFQGKHVFVVGRETTS